MMWQRRISLEQAVTRSGAVVSSTEPDTVVDALLLETTGRGRLGHGELPEGSMPEDPGPYSSSSSSSMCSISSSSAASGSSANRLPTNASTSIAEASGSGTPCD
jgi:hypothetical protein